MRTFRQIACRILTHLCLLLSTPSKGGDVSEFLAVLDSWKMKASRQSTADVASAPTDDLADKIEKLKSDVGTFPSILYQNPYTSICRPQLLSLTSVIGTAEV